MIWAIILAAGKSERMGTPKLLLPWRGTTIIETVVRNVLASETDGVLVVLGADRDRIEPLIGPYPLQTVVNPDPSRGMLSSVQLGFDRLPAEVRAALVLPGDQPQVGGKTIDRIIDAYERSGRGIVLPVFGGRRGHPVLIETRFRAEVMSLDPRVGLRQLIHGHPDDLLELKVRNRSILTDIDTPSEYARQRRALRR